MNVCFVWFPYGYGTIFPPPADLVVQYVFVDILLTFVGMTLFEFTTHIPLGLNIFLFSASDLFITKSSNLHACSVSEGTTSHFLKYHIWPLKFIFLRPFSKVWE